MTRRAGASGQRRGRSAASRGAATPRRRAVIGWAAVLVLVGIALFPMVKTGGGGSSHPEPRTGVSARYVLPPSTFRVGRIQQAYAVAGVVPQVLDGLYCYCECARHAGHRSLLTCFESVHGSQCDVCMNEAELAHRLSRDGKDLSAIRAAIDARFGS